MNSLLIRIAGKLRNLAPNDPEVAELLNEIKAQLEGQTSPKQFVAGQQFVVPIEEVLIWVAYGGGGGAEVTLPPGMQVICAGPANGSGGGPLGAMERREKCK